MTTTTTTGDAIATLDAQYFNALVAQLTLDATTFQLAQGEVSIAPDSDSIWNFFDSIPPLSLTHRWDSSGFNSLSSDYAAVIGNLVTQTDDALRKLLGDKYVQWDAYRSNDKNQPNPLPTKGGLPDIVGIQVQMFEKWGLTALDANTINAGVTILTQSDAVSVAQAMLVAAKGPNNGDFPYTATYSQLQNVPANPKTVSFNSANYSADTSHAWAHGEAAGFFDVFFGGAKVSWDTFDQQVASAGVQVDITFQKVITLSGRPLSKVDSVNPDLTSYVPWYSSGALNLAKHHDDNTVWRTGAPTWDDTFGPEGNLQRFTSQLIVVDGVDVTIKTNFAVSSDDQTTIDASFEAGFWPFFAASGEGGWTHDKPQYSSSGATLHSSSKAGYPIVLGVSVEPIDALLGGS